MKKFYAIIDEHTCLGCRTADELELPDEDAARFDPHDENSSHKCRCYWYSIESNNDNNPK